MQADAAGQKCETCYGEGQVPTDSGPSPAPTAAAAKDVEWLVFELRRARGTLTELLSLADDVDGDQARSRMLFVIRRALGL